MVAESLPSCMVLCHIGEQNMRDFNIRTFFIFTVEQNTRLSLRLKETYFANKFEGKVSVFILEISVTILRFFFFMLLEIWVVLEKTQSKK